MSKKQLLIVYAGHSPSGSTATLAKWIAGNIGGQVPDQPGLCDPGQVIMHCDNGNPTCAYPGTDPSQTPNCKRPAGICPPGQVSIRCENGNQICAHPGTDPSSNPICQTAPHSTCPKGHVIMHCPNGKTVCGISGTDPSSNPNCKTTSLGAKKQGNIGGPVGAIKYVNVIIKSASDATADDVNNADGIVLGSGTYNGNPEPDMIEFVDNKLGAGKAEAVLAGKIVGTFCTSAGYATGAQPVLNGLARLAMTFGATLVGGGNWHTSQGVCGMVNDHHDGTWNWDPSMKYLQEDAQAYGERLGMITSFFSDSYIKAQGEIPLTGQVITCGKCNSNKHKKGKYNNICWFLVPALLIATVLFIILSMKKRDE